MNQAIFVLSPHLDDAALSCGASIYKWLRQGKQVTVVNVASNYQLPEKLSDFATLVHQHMGLTSPLGAAQRLEEDLAAMTILGADAMHANFYDALYRFGDNGEHYSAYPQLTSSLPSWEAGHLAQLSEYFHQLAQANTQALFIAPMAVGNHVDHQLVKQAAMQGIAPKQLWFYEDYPYSDDELGHKFGQPSSELAQLAGTAPHGVAHHERITPEQLTAKQYAIEAYKTQVNGLFPNTKPLSERLRLNASRYTHFLNETFWR